MRSLSNVPTQSAVGYMVLGLIFIFHLFGVDIKDMAHDLGTAISGFVNATVVLGSVGMTLWGHIQLARQHGALRQIAFNAGVPAPAIKAPVAHLAAASSAQPTVPTTDLINK